VKYLHLVRHNLTATDLLVHSLSFLAKSHMLCLDVGITASNLWSSVLTQPHEFAQSCITSQWSSPQQCHRDANEDAKKSDWLNNSYSVSNVAKDSTLNDQMVSPVEQKKPETTANYRLFGIDLMSSSLAVPEEKTAPMRPINISKPTMDSHSDPKSEISKVSEEKKQEPAEGSPKEVQSKQSSSTRSRTKVYICLHGYREVYIHCVICELQNRYTLCIMFAGLNRILNSLSLNRCRCKAYLWAGLWI